MRVNTSTQEEHAENTVDNAAVVLDRDTYRRIKQMDRLAMEALLNDVFENGRNKGVQDAGGSDDTSAQNTEASDTQSATTDGSADFDAMRTEIRSIAGIGEKRADAIMDIVLKYVK